MYSEHQYNAQVLKCIFYAAERNQILEHNPCAGISGKGGKPTKKKEMCIRDSSNPALLLYPGICLIVCCAGFNLLGAGLRDAIGKEDDICVA